MVFTSVPQLEDQDHRKEVQQIEQWQERSVLVAKQRMARGTLGPTGCSLQRIYEGQLTDTPRSPTEIVEV